MPREMDKHVVAVTMTDRQIESLRRMKAQLGYETDGALIRHALADLWHDLHPEEER
jgi:hypothetical protein